MTGEFLAQRASNVENVSIWWCHHARPLSSPRPRLGRVLLGEATHLIVSDDRRIRSVFVFVQDRISCHKYMSVEPFRTTGLGLYALSGKTSYHKISFLISKSRDSRLNFSNRSEIWQVCRQQRCRHASQIADTNLKLRYNHYNIQSRGFEPSRDLAVRRLTASWMEAQVDTQRICVMLKAMIIAYLADSKVTNNSVAHTTPKQHPFVVI